MENKIQSPWDPECHEHFVYNADQWRVGGAVTASLDSREWHWLAASGSVATEEFSRKEDGDETIIS